MKLSGIAPPAGTPLHGGIALAADGGAVQTLIIFTVIVGLFMMQCQLPAKITFCPAENTVFSVVAYILLYGLCGILLYASAEAVYLGIYHDAALFWMMIYTMISVSSGRINRKKTGDGK